VRCPAAPNVGPLNPDSSPVDHTQYPNRGLQGSVIGLSSPSRHERTIQYLPRNPRLRGLFRRCPCLNQHQGCSSQTGGLDEIPDTKRFCVTEEALHSASPGPRTGCSVTVASCCGSGSRPRDPCSRRDRRRMKCPQREMNLLRWQSGRLSRSIDNRPNAVFNATAIVAAIFDKTVIVAMGIQEPEGGRPAGADGLTPSRAAIQ
jgi:hypothetical protein